jgi:hypothetical protein
LITIKAESDAEDLVLIQPPEQAPLQSRSRHKEWQEAVELDRLLEQERLEASKKRLKLSTDAKIHAYIEKSKNTAMRV